MEQFTFFLRIQFLFCLQTAPIMEIQAPSYPFLKGIPSRQETACAMTTTRKPCTAAGWLLAAEQDV